MNDTLRKCPKCKNDFSDKPKKNFLGFPTITCKSCGDKIHYPLSTTYRIIYYVLAAVAVYGIVIVLAGGDTGFLAITGLAAIFALIKDRQYASKIKTWSNESD